MPTKRANKVKADESIAWVREDDDGGLTVCVESEDGSQRQYKAPKGTDPGPDVLAYQRVGEEPEPPFVLDEEPTGSKREARNWPAEGSGMKASALDG